MLMVNTAMEFTAHHKPWNQMSPPNNTMVVNIAQGPPPPKILPEFHPLLLHNYSITYALLIDPVG